MRITIVLLMLFQNLKLHAQEPVFKQFTIADGLPSNTVYHAMQDKSGKMWFATDNGICSYDGARFVTYNAQNGLPSVAFYTCYEDPFDRIWFVGQTKKLYYFRNDSIHPFRYNFILEEQIPNLVHPFKNGFHVLKDSSIIFSCKGQAPIRIWPNGDWSLIKHRDEPVFVEQIEDKSIFGINHELVYSDKAGGISTYLKGEHYHYAGRMISNDPGFVMHSLKDQQVWLTYGNTLFSYNHEKFESFEFDKHLTWIKAESVSKCWAGFYNGGLRYIDIQNNELVTCEHYLKSESVSCSINDKNGGMWITTLDNGVFYTQSTALKVSRNSNIRQVLNAVSINNRLIWAQKNGYLGMIYNGDTNLVKTPFNHIEKMIKVDSHLIVLSQQSLHFYNASLKEEKALPSDILINPKDVLLRGDTLFMASVTGLWEYYNGHFWHNRIYFDPSEDTMAASRVMNIRISALTNAGSDIILASENKLYKITANPKHPFTSFGKSLPSQISDIEWNNEQEHLLIGTRQHGLWLLDNGRLRNILSPSENQFITNVTIGTENIWVSTQREIICLDKHSYGMRFALGSLHGLKDQTISKISEINDKLYIGTGEHLFSLNWKNYRPLDDFPTAKINSILLNDKPISRFDNQFSYDQNNITFTFSGTTYSHADQQTYEYRLVGSNQSWTQTHSNLLNFTNLSPANYAFEVRVINRDGKLSILPASFQFSILPPFWSTWWFSILVLFFIMTIAVVLIKVRIHAIHEKQALLNKLNFSRQQSLSQQMNPHFVYNCMNSIQNFILRNDVRSSNYYLGQFATLMRNNLENSQHTLISLDKEIDALGTYLRLEQMRFRNRFKYEIRMSESLDASELFIPSLLLQPFAENAIIHGFSTIDEEGNLIIDIDEQNNYLAIKIDDNGIGINKSREMKKGIIKKHHSLGMSISMHRIQLINEYYNCDMHVEYLDKSEKGKKQGTIVKIFIPIINHE